jgi:hypothetical protein
MPTVKCNRYANSLTRGYTDAICFLHPFNSPIKTVKEAKAMKRKFTSIALCLVFTLSVVSICFGMQQSVIMDYQKKLKNLGYYSGEPHGQLDEATIAAIKACQKACGVKETGKMTKGTCAVIDKALKDKEAKEKAK